MTLAALPWAISLGFALLVAGSGAEPVRRPTVEELEVVLDATALDRYGDDALSPARAEPAYQMFLRFEPADVPDHMLVAVLLAGSTRRSPVDVALDLMRSAEGDVVQLSNAQIFRSTPGVGDSGRARLLAATELARRIQYRKAMQQQKPITSAYDAMKVLETLSTGPYEKLSAIYLDRRNRVVGTRLLTVGSDAFTIVDPRQVLRPALELQARAIILAHQHPSGDPEPSSADLQVTERTQRAGRALGVQLLDHIVIGGQGRWVSLAERGELPHWSQEASYTL